MFLKLIAFESLGVRSQATYIQTSDTSIFIDPSAALAPRRYNLPPHRIEALRLLEVFGSISSFIQDSEYVVITHYHYDHHDPGRFIDIDIYRNRTFLVKDPHHYINLSQKMRADRFLKIVKERSKKVKIADGSTIDVGRTQILFSHPLPHGENSRLGYVLSLCIKDEDFAILFTSDIEGGPLDDHLQIFKICSPRIAIVDGPPTYLLNYSYSMNSFERSLQFLRLFSRISELETIIIDHHICRELNYLDKISRVMEDFIKAGKRIVNAANFMGIEPRFLEARRRELYSREPANGINILKSNIRSSDVDLGDTD